MGRIPEWWKASPPPKSTGGYVDLTDAILTMFCMPYVLLCDVFMCVDEAVEADEGGADVQPVHRTV